MRVIGFARTIVSSRGIMSFVHSSRSCLLISIAASCFFAFSKVSCVPRTFVFFLSITTYLSPLRTMVSESFRCSENLFILSVCMISSVKESAVNVGESSCIQCRPMQESSSMCLHPTKAQKSILLLRTG